MRNFTRIGVAALGAAMSAISFGQVALPAGTTVLNPVVNSTAIAGYALVAEATSTFTGVNALGQTEFTGTLISEVGQNVVTGDLAFGWGVENDPTSADAITSFSVSHYAGWATSVAQVASGGVDALLASRTATGDVITFSFLPGSGGSFDELNPGDFSDFEVVFTTAQFYTIGSAQLSDGGIATVPTFAPATPEPAPFVALGIGMLGLIRRRAKK